MYGKGRAKGLVRFLHRPDGTAWTVAVAGDFSDWRPVAMKRRADGTFVRHVPVPSGTFEYKFVVDGKWVTDGDHSAWSFNAYGTFNSVGRA